MYSTANIIDCVTFEYGGVVGVTVIVVENGIGNPISYPGRGCLLLTSY